MPARTKSKSTAKGHAAALLTRPQVEALAQSIVRAQIDRETLVASRDQAVLAASEQYQPEIEALAQAIDADLSLLESWAAAHPEEFPRDSRSTTLAGHRIGWRKGQPRAKGKRGWTWAKILDLLLQSPDDLRARYLRTKHEIDRAALIAARDHHPEDLAALQVTIEQAETFYLDPSRDGQDPALLTR
jgi:phage host-nuclease inhibitor protein Gam